MKNKLEHMLNISCISALGSALVLFVYVIFVVINWFVPPLITPLYWLFISLGVLSTITYLSGYLLYRFDASSYWMNKKFSEYTGETADGAITKIKDLYKWLFSKKLEAVASSKPK